MMRQVINRQGRMINPLQAILFFGAMLLFIFTVVYRMVKSDSFSTALATLVESLSIVISFIFIGIVIAYLLYVIQERIREGSRHQPGYTVLDNTSAEDESTCKSDRFEFELDADQKAESRQNS